MRTRTLAVVCDVCGDGITWHRRQLAVDPTREAAAPLTLEERERIRAASAGARFDVIEDVYAARAYDRRAAHVPPLEAAGGAGWDLTPDRDLCPRCRAVVAAPSSTTVAGK